MNLGMHLIAKSTDTGIIEPVIKAQTPRAGAKPSAGWIDISLTADDARHHGGQCAVCEGVIDDSNIRRRHRLGSKCYSVLMGFTHTYLINVTACANYDSQVWHMLGNTIQHQVHEYVMKPWTDAFRKLLDDLKKQQATVAS